MKRQDIEAALMFAAVLLVASSWATCIAYMVHLAVR